MKVAIIIPVFNNLDFTKKCLQSLNSLQFIINDKEIVYEAVVIDDGSTDGTEQWVKHNFPTVHLVKGDGNLWWSGSATKGTEYALNDIGCDFILLWNNDIIPAPNYFEEVAKLVANYPQRTVLGSKISDTSTPPKVWSMGGVYNTKNGKKFMYGLDLRVPDMPNGYLSVDWLTGMGTVIPKEVFTEIGYWNYKDFPQYHGDSDFTFRAKRAGYELKVYPQLEIFNDTSNSGMLHDGTFKGLRNSLKSVRSKYNWEKDVKFYKMYANSIFGFWHLYLKYFKYIGGFLKWKLLTSLGIKKG